MAHDTRGDYLVSDQHRLVYCPIEKAGCSTGLAWFCHIHGQAYERDLPRAYWLRRRPPGTWAALFRDYFTFAFVRDPWARLVSVFLEKHCRPGRVYTFRQFVDLFCKGNPDEFDRHYKPLSWFLQDVAFDALWPLREMTQRLGEIGERIGINPPVGKRNSTPRLGGEWPLVADWTPEMLLGHEAFPTYPHFYDDALRERVGEVYAEDVSRFGFEFGRQ